MLRGLRKLIKGHKKEDRKRRDYDIDADGKLVLDVKLDSPDKAYSEFSPECDLRMNPELKDYLSAENAPLINKLHIKIYNDELAGDKNAQIILTDTFSAAFKDDRRKKYSQLRFCLLRCFACLIAGLLVLTLTIILNYFDRIGIFFNSMEILAWVFIWETADLFFFERPDIKREYYHLSKLTDASYEFTGLL